jgi:lipopolysaccharide/colanic/teichoic acid biosynthesis glycosyltransferase
MKIAITGASGYIGKQLICALRNYPYDLVLFGRSLEKLQKLFPSKLSEDYSNIATGLRGVDVVIHLAVKNNDSDGLIEEFRSANVALLSDFAKHAVANEVKLFLNVTTLHGEQGPKSSKYGQTKAEGRKLLESFTDLKIVNLVLPAVYSPDGFRGKLGMLNSLPPFLRRAGFLALSALKPTLSASTLTARIVAVIDGLGSTRREVLVSDEQMHNPVYAGVKRTVDLCFAITVSVLIWPILLAAWLAIRVDSSGPAIFKQERVGRFGKVFQCYKFRTMATGTKQAGSHEVSAASITRVGKLLRRTKVDELPQIMNIFRNEMSLVGPRPNLPSQTTLTEVRRRLGVYNVKPGITGLAQIKGIDMSTPDQLAECDARYIAIRTLPLDTRILIATFAGQGQGDAVRS